MTREDTRMITATNNTSSSSAAGSGSGVTAVNGAGSEDRFLKLLVAQLSNQDPLNPMDNAQMTSQMAQISTVSSIEKVNASLGGLASQLASLQMLQASSLVGRNVLVEGNKLAIHAGQAGGAIDLPSRADSVAIDILSAGGQVIDSMQLGRQEAGRHEFTWDASTHPGLSAATYRVSALSGGKALATTQLVRDQVEAVSADSGVMNLQLRGLGSVAYSTVKSIL